MEAKVTVARGFASYSSTDREAVIRAVSLLRSTGLDLFVDFVTLRGGDQWEDRISNAIAAVDKFYVFWSKNAASSEWVAFEVQKALRRANTSCIKDFIVPVLLDDTQLPDYLAKYHSVDLSSIAEGATLGFVTERIIPAEHGFDLQFSVSNPNKNAELNVFEIIPVVLDWHHKVLYAPGTPHRLSPITMNSLRKLRRIPSHRILQSGDGVFMGLSLIHDQYYRLKPNEIDTFRCELIVDLEQEAVWALGLFVKYSDSKGQSRCRPSDCVFVIDKDISTVSIARYDLDRVNQRLGKIEEYDYYQDVAAQKRFDGMYEVYQGVSCPWESMLGKCKAFLELKTGLPDLHAMEEER